MKTYRYRLLITLFILIVGVIAYFLFTSANSFSFSVETDPGASVYLAESKGGEFKEVGNGSTVVKTTVEGSVFVKAESSGKSSVATVNTLSDVEGLVVNLPLTETRTATRLSNWPLSNLYITKDFVYGLNPSSKALSYAPLSEKLIPRFSYSFLPYISDIAWQSKDDFIYRSGWVRKVVDGKSREYSVSGAEGSTISFIAFDKYPNRPFILLSPAGIYKHTDLSKGEPRLIAQIDRVASPFLFTDKNYIYLFNYIFDNADEQEGSTPVVKETKIIVFDYSGKVVHNISTVLQSTVSSVVLENNKLHILADTLIYELDITNNTLNSGEFYFQSMNDMVRVNGVIYMLGTGGLWSFDTNTGVHSLLSAYSEGEEYISRSLTYGEGCNCLFYSTRSITGDSGLFRVKL